MCAESPQRMRASVTVRLTVVWTMTPPTVYDVRTPVGK
jgi:hypothetical protein